MLARKLSPEKKTIKGSSPETLFRVTLRNQLKAISIADQKAKVIIGINTILVSLFIGLIGLVSNVTQLHFITNLNLSLPFTVMIISSFLSAALAILVVRPDKRMWSESNASNLSFMDFTNLDLEDYIDDVMSILTSKKSIHTNLIIDLYYYGKCIQRKNRLLRSAYNVFLGGLTVAVASFIFLQLTQPNTIAFIASS